MQNTDPNVVLGKMIVKQGKRMIDGDCGLDDDEIFAMVELICTRKLNMEQASTMLNIDPTTLRRKIRDGELPHPRKEAGGKKYYFVKDIKKHHRKNG